MILAVLVGKKEGLASLALIFMILVARSLAFSTTGKTFTHRAPSWARIMKQFSPRPTCCQLSAAVTTQAMDEKLVQDMLYRVRQVNIMPDDIKASSLVFQVDGVKLGKVRPKMAQKLGSTNAFELHDDFLTLSTEAGTTSQERTEAVMKVMEELREDGTIRGWRDELLPITEGFYSVPMFLMERAAVPLLGALEYGVHLNGMVQKNGRDVMWMARRSKSKSKYPGMMDHMVAGGLPAGLGLLENVIKECEEEAGIPAELTKAGLVSTGAISYENYEKENDMISRAVLFCYDLYLPADFQPIAMDGEVEEFFQWEIEQLLESCSPTFPDPIKPNCYPVIIDHLLRKGYVSPDTPGYLNLLCVLRSGECK